MHMEVDNDPQTEYDHSDTPSNRQTTSPHPIPDSVRGAPEELKPAIRKKQNKESARRSRRRRKELELNLGHSITMLMEKTQELEARLDSMERYLSKLGFDVFQQPRLQYPVLARSLPSSAGPSHSGSIVLGSDGASQTRGQGSASATRGKRAGGVADEDIEDLVASCLEQL